jgi:hypothetical protein
MGRRKSDGNHSPPKKKFNTGFRGNEENAYPVPDSNKTKINDTKEPNDVHKNFLQEEILQVIIKNFMKMFQTSLTKTYKRYSRKFKIPKTEYMRQRNK